MMRKRAPRAATNLKFLAARYGDEHWREVIRLFVAMAPRSLFETFMQAVVAAGGLAGRHEYTSRCLREALQPSERPFVKALSNAAQRYDALQALSVLRDLNPEPLRRVAEALNAEPERFFRVAASALAAAERDLAARLLAPAAPSPAPHPPAAAGPVVFISYSSRDKAVVTRLRSALEQSGIRVWLDVGEINPGDVITKRLEEGITESTFFLPVLSPHFLRSSWTQLEENLAWQREVEEGRVVVVPLLLQGELRHLPLRYRQRRFVDLRGDFDAGMAELLAFLRQPAERVLVRMNAVDATELVLVPAGAFQAGKPEQPDNKPRQMELPAFYLARYPVTNAQYRKYLDASREAAKPEYWDDERFNQPQQPVVSVSWHDAQAYCKWAGLRLPTEWEWEKGARGTDGRPYPWGKDDPDPSRAVFGNLSGQPAPVGSCPAGASPYGLMDMAGNVWEWTASDYDKGPRKTVRGGSFYDVARNLRAAIRYGNHPDSRSRSIGFRCAQDP
jgi:formylglycine-generating enzyme required for sulfatase activity/molybdopterin-guanine dinucleotide biosynthesis protein A